MAAAESTALIQLLAWEHPHAMGAPLTKKKKKKEKKERKEKKMLDEVKCMNEKWNVWTVR